MKIYYQYSSAKVLGLKGGDFITEVGIVTALSQFADVYYSGTYFDPSKPGFGLTDYSGSIASRVTEAYDAYVIRASREAFLAAPSTKPRLWNAAPFDRDCYRRATAVFCFSQAWKEDLLGPNTYTGISKSQRVRPKRTVVIHQVVGDAFKPLQASAHTHRLRKEIGEGFIIGFFGCSRKSRYPYGFLRMWPGFVRAHPQARLLLAVPQRAPNRKNIPFPSSLPNVTRRAFSHDEVPYALSACDLMLVGRQQQAGEIGGCSKTIEAAACGVPIMLGRHAARVEVLGEDYPFYVPPIGGWNSGEEGIQQDAAAAREMLEQIIGDDDHRREVADSLLAKAEWFSVARSGKRLKKLFRKLVK